MDKRSAAIFLMFFVLLPALSACNREIYLPKGKYAIEGLEKKGELYPFLKGIMKERLAEKIPVEKDHEQQLRRDGERARAIQADLTEALHAKGYYDAEVQFTQGKKDFSGAFHPQPGTQYKIAAVNITPKAYVKMKTGLASGAPLDAEAVLNAQKKLYDAIQKDGCHFDLNVENETALDQSRKTATITFVVLAGAPAKFGDVKFSGHERVEESYLRKLLPWRKGDCFRREQIENYRATLLGSGLFARADAALPDAPGKDGGVPMTFELKERARRTVGAGLKYYTDEGPGVLLDWEHRNFLGSAERVKVALQATSIKQSLDGSFTKPWFERKGQNLSITSGLIRQETDAYDETGINAAIRVDRRFHERLTASAGPALTFTRIQDATTLQTENFGLLSFPVSLTFDNRDNALDPKRGWSATASIAPYADLLGTSSPFLKARATASTYFPLDKRKRNVIALRGSVGSIIGPAATKIPATERFYAGGGGSVRGFGYQDIGPQKFGEPEGGRSVVEGSAEYRFRISDTLGAAVFTDAGSVSSLSSPDFKELSVGAGAGLRYLTAFGPLRFDVATPLTGDKNTSSSYQIYISIGQAF
jgi:translocation and assembly module TamA